MRAASATEETWLPLARPIIARLDGSWQDSDRALARMAHPELRLFAAQQLGFVDRRRHWLTRRWQARLSVKALTSNKLAAERRRAGRVG